MWSGQAEEDGSQAESEGVQGDEGDEVEERLPGVEIGTGSGYRHRKIYFGEGRKGASKVVLLPSRFQQDVPDGLAVDALLQGLLGELAQFFVHGFLSASYLRRPVICSFTVSYIVARGRIIVLRTPYRLDVAGKPATRFVGGRDSRYRTWRPRSTPGSEQRPLRVGLRGALGTICRMAHRTTRWGRGTCGG